MKQFLLAAIAALTFTDLQAATVPLTYNSGPLSVTESCATDLWSVCGPFSGPGGVPLQRLSYTVEFSVEDAGADFSTGTARFGYFDGNLTFDALSLFAEAEDGATLLFRREGLADITLLDLWVAVDPAYGIVELLLQSEMQVDLSSVAAANTPGPYSSFYIDSYPDFGPTVLAWFDDQLERDQLSHGRYGAEISAVPLPAMAPVAALALGIMFGAGRLRRKTA